MSRKKISLIIIVLIACSAVFFVTNKDIKLSSLKTTVNDVKIPNIEPIASIPDEDIFLYPVESSKKDGLYKELILSINGVNKKFNWETIAKIEDSPELKYLDLNTDGKKELVILLSRGGGTGSVRETIHIVNPENFIEYKIENPVNIIKDNVRTKILSKKEMEIELNGNIYNIKIDNVPKKLSGIYPNEISEIYYEDFIDYQIIDNTLSAIVGVEGDFLKYLGYIIIDYSFKDGEFKANKITFEELK